MSAVIGGVLVVLGGGGIAWMFVHIRNVVYRLVPGAAPRGTPERPRLLVEGHPLPGPTPLLAPLSGRPCAAWKLSVEYVERHRGVMDPYRPTYVEYGAADFGIQTVEGLVHVHVDASTIQREFPESAESPWVIPRGANVESLSVAIIGDQAVINPDSRLQEPAKRQAEDRALAQVSDFLPPNSNPTQIRVIEYLVDFSREWLCEGPLHADGDKRTIASMPDDAFPVKLAPQASMLIVKATVILPTAALMLLLLCIVLIPGVVLLIS